MKRINGHVSAWLVVVCIYIALVVVTEVAHKLALFTLTLLICVPVIAWWKTGSFTYWPVINTKSDNTSFKPQRTYEHQRAGQTQCKRDTPKTYDLSDIPHPPKRRNDAHLKNLPQGNGITPPTSKQRPKTVQCALVAKRAKQSIEENAAPTIGSVDDLIKDQTRIVDTPEDILVVPDGDVFL
ncbi:hypothetical protein [Pseudomonas sp. XWY-1]|uniref:hypothetical protein n=1 Tax=Pseudomonas sp. XWY-1 TaxID=2069256 RepID=UPI000CF540A1|nr:hypothetical protein [Pseudomonas sp. XWY-1]